MATTTGTTQGVKPWYREPWPWFLMAGPFIVIVAGIVTAWLAVSSSDGLVTEDYYKQGQAAGETLSRSRRADELGLQAGIRLKAEGIRVRLSSQAAVPFPDMLQVTLSHPTRAGLDQKSQLRRDGDAYVGEMHLPRSGHWLVLVEDEARSWRLMGSVVLPAADETVIGGGAAAAEKPQS
ncbi:MAG: FixH family protein [Pseudomonadota bacterium]